MTGNWKWSVYAAIFALVLTLAASLLNDNTLLTSLIRSAYSFCIVFLFVLALQWGLGETAVFRSLPEKSGEAQQTGQSGRELDLVTPDDPALIDLLSRKEPGSKPDFLPLIPEQLVSKSKIDAGFLAEATRNLSDDEGR